MSDLAWPVSGIVMPGAVDSFGALVGIGGGTAALDLDVFIDLLGDFGCAVSCAVDSAASRDKIFLPSASFSGVIPNFDNATLAASAWFICFSC